MFLLAIAWGRRIRRLIRRLLTADFCLRLVQCFFGFSMDCFGSFLCFLAYCLGGFLGLSPDGLGSFFGFFTDCFRGFLGLFACGFESVFDRLPCFFCSVLYVFECSFLRERNKRCSNDQSDNKARYFHDYLLLFAVPVLENGLGAFIGRIEQPPKRWRDSANSGYAALQHMRP
jgi:hypothetical protein